MYLLAVAAKGRDLGAEGTLHFGFDFSKLPEDKQPASNAIFMQRLAKAGHGKVMTQGLESLSDNPMPGYRDAWPPAAIVAMLLFMFDLLRNKRQAAK